MSVLKQQEVPEIWVAAGEGCSFLENFSYVLSELPRKGKLFSEQDRLVIKVKAKAPLFASITWIQLGSHSYSSTCGDTLGAVHSDVVGL